MVKLGLKSVLLVPLVQVEVPPAQLEELRQKLEEIQAQLPQLKLSQAELPAELPPPSPASLPEGVSVAPGAVAGVKPGAPGLGITLVKVTARGRQYEILTL